MSIEEKEKRKERVRKIILTYKRVRQIYQK